MTARRRLLMYMLLAHLLVRGTNAFYQTPRAVAKICWIRSPIHTVTSISSTAGDDVGQERVSATIGSDALYRPDDEDSPEYQEYLKKLLQMQRNRAKTGYSAPSSRSTDAYFAKLNRIKLEKLARFRSGLPYDNIDTSYKPIDFEYAANEASDVAVTAGDANAGSQGGGRVRPINAAERNLLRLAEEAAKAESNSKTSNRGTEIAGKQPEHSAAPLNRDTQNIASIPRSHSVPSLRKVPNHNSISTSSQTVDPAPVRVPASTTAPEQAARSAAVPKVIPGAASKTMPGAASKAILKRTLEKDELEIAGKALQLTVMHRGGGPYGSGRLMGEKADDLKTALLNLYEMLVKDSASASPDVVIPNGQLVEDEEMKLPPVKAIPPSRSQPNIESDRQIHKASVQKSSMQKNTDFTEDMPQQTIAQGLDSYLMHPEAMRIEELQGLREGLLQCLSMIQKSIDDREQESVQDPAERLISKHEQEIHSVPPPAAYPIDLDPEQLVKEVKLALGLLLKHRGGPGFGHGRLTGRELDNLENSLRKVSESLLQEASE